MYPDTKLHNINSFYIRVRSIIIDFGRDALTKQVISISKLDCPTFEELNRDRLTRYY